MKNEIEELRHIIDQSWIQVEMAHAETECLIQANYELISHVLNTDEKSNFLSNFHETLASKKIERLNQLSNENGLFHPQKLVFHQLSVSEQLTVSREMYEKK